MSTTPRTPRPGEVELLAALVGDPAYILLMDTLDEVVYNLTESLAHANFAQAGEILPLWRVLKSVTTTLRQTPEQAAGWLASTPQPPESFGRPTNPAINDQLKAYYAALEKANTLPVTDRIRQYQNIPNPGLSLVPSPPPNET